MTGNTRRAPERRAIISADDFGLSIAVNEGIERAHRDGLLSTASLMVAGDAAADAVRRARSMPNLKVGLHLVAIEGPAVLPPAEIAELLDGEGRIPSDQLGLGLRYAFHPRVKAQLSREIAAQFRTFSATGLTLDHANAHKHMHLHPVVGRMMIAAGQQYGLRAMRIPAEPAGVMAGLGIPQGIGARALLAWTQLLRAQARRARLAVNDHAFGIAWSGHMTEHRLLTLAPCLPPGLSEIYFHPAAGRDAVLDRFMPDYEHEAELAALTSPRLATTFTTAGIGLTTWSNPHEGTLPR
ncbi:hopanoid biosynthesis-associated protein HpnK [Acidisoma silvae]|uniref:Hopanoid biosynthesis-associated protein HpnK n=1 Tax=Acidisoma silvae TaxID=2802396 RepID=A0A963YTN1_9PROT|nr:hopanoid biosynthesis-associated protein HpnK [Acidisoma silvae]MCB8876731.1 hopanoid biosynthesis-associated protein HpnK [Acidisoma silvae]